MLRTGSFFLFILLFVACQEAKVEEIGYTKTLASYVIDNKLNYNQVLKKALELDDPTVAKVKKILVSYRKNVKKRPEREEILRKNREKKLSKVFTSAQMKKRKYVNAIYYNTKPKYPAHPVNIKKLYSLTDGQVLKLIEVEDIFVVDKNKVERKKRISELIGSQNAEKYLAGKTIII